MVAAATLVRSISLWGRTPAGTPPPEQEANIVFILADDYGTGEVSSYGADTTRRRRSTNSPAEACDSPTVHGAVVRSVRALILTDLRVPHRGDNQDATGLMKPSVETMMPKVLKPAGYVSAAIGKWASSRSGRPTSASTTTLLHGSGIYWNTQEKGRRTS